MSGLLGDSWNDPRTMATLNMAAGLLSGGNFGQALGRGLQGYTQSMGAAEDAKLRKMQMDEMQRKIAEQRGQQEWRAGLPAMLQKQTMVPNDAGPTAAPDTEAINKYLLDPRSPFADKMLERQLFPKEAEAFTLGEGQVRYDGQGRVVAQGPEKKEATPAEIRGYELAQSQGFKGSFFDYQSALKRAGANQTSIINTQERAESKAVGEFFGGSYADIQKAGMNASSKLNRYDRLGSLLEGVSTGKFTPFGVEVAKTAESLGIKIDPSLPNKEAAQALSGEIALELRNPSGGAGMPGAMSDADRQFLVSMVPGLTTTPQGRKLMLDTARKLAQRDQDVARLAREYRTRNGSIDEGFYNMLSAWSAQNQLFPQSSVMRANPNAPSAPKSAGARFLGFEQ